MNRIALHYLNPIQGTITVLKDYEDMLWRYERTKDQLAEANSRLYSPGHAITDRMPRRGGGNGTQDHWARAIDQRDLLLSGRQECQDFLDWFNPAWQQLDNEEQELLRQRYMQRREVPGEWVEDVRDSLHIERTKAYQKSENALKRLSSLLFWSVT